MVLEIPLTGLMTQIVAFPFEFSAGLIFIFAALFVLRKRIDYKHKSIEIKEAPAGVNNLLRDRIKRDILLSLSQQKKYVSKIGREVGLDPARARHHVKSLENYGLVKAIKLTREAYFSLTEKGHWSIKALRKYYPKTVFAWLLSRVSIPLEKHDDEDWYKVEKTDIKRGVSGTTEIPDTDETSNSSIPENLQLKKS